MLGQAYITTGASLPVILSDVSSFSNSPSTGTPTAFGVIFYDNVLYKYFTYLLFTYLLTYLSEKISLRISPYLSQTVTSFGSFGQWPRRKHGYQLHLNACIIFRISSFFCLLYTKLYSPQSMVAIKQYKWKKNKKQTSYA